MRTFFHLALCWATGLNIFAAIRATMVGELQLVATALGLVVAGLVAIAILPKLPLRVWR